MGGKVARNIGPPGRKQNLETKEFHVRLQKMGEISTTKKPIEKINLLSITRRKGKSVPLTPQRATEHIQTKAEGA